MMKSLALLVALIISCQAMATYTPVTAKGQLNGTKEQMVNLEVPNKLITKVGPTTFLTENGNKNLLANPSFEHATASTGWTVGGSPVEETTVVIDGKKSLMFPAAAAFSLLQLSTLYNQQLADGVQGLAMVRIKTTLTTIKVCSVVTSVVSTTNCVSHTGSGKWELIKVPFITGNGNNGISIVATATTTAPVYIDDAFVGVVDLKTDAPKVSTQSVTFNQVNSAMLDRTAGIRFNTATWTYNSRGTTMLGTEDDAAGTRTKFTTTKKVLVEVQFRVTQVTAGQELYIYRNEELQAISGNTSGASSNGHVSASFELMPGEYFYFSSSNTATNDANALHATIVATEIVNGSTYSSNNADFGWTPFTPTWTGLTVGNATQKFFYKRMGDTAHIKGNLIFGSTTSATGMITLSLPSGLSANTSKMPGTVAGGYARIGIGTFYDSTNGVKSLLMILQNDQQDNFYLSGKDGATTVDPLTNTSNTWTTADEIQVINMEVPIKGWEQSNVIIGQFNGLESCADTFQCTDTYTAQVNQAGAITSTSVSGWTTSSRTSTGLYQLTFKSGLFTVAPSCTASAYSNVAGNANVAFPTAATATGIQVASNDTVTGAPGDDSFTIICQKQGVDYIGKTAKAVASDQNVRSIGSTGMDNQFAYFGSGAQCNTPCTTGTCTICKQVGTKITSITWNAGTGSYRVNGLDGFKYSCFGTSFNSTTSVPTVFTNDLVNASTSYVQVYSSNPAGPQNAGYASLNCIGIP